MIDAMWFHDDSTFVAELTTLGAFLVGAYLSSRSRKPRGMRKPQKDIDNGGKTSWPTRSAGKARSQDPSSTWNSSPVDNRLVEAVVQSCRTGAVTQAEVGLTALLRSRSSVAADGSGGSSGAVVPPGKTRPDTAVWRVVEACLLSPSDNTNASRAAAWLRRLQDAGFRISSRPLFAVMDALTRGDHPEVAAATGLLKEVLSARGFPDVACYQVLFDRCIPAGDEAQVVWWLKHLAKKGKHEQTQGFVAIIRSEVHCANSEKVDQRMGNALFYGATQSTHLYNAAIHACARYGDVKRAVHWFSCLERASRAPDGGGGGGGGGGAPETAGKGAERPRGFDRTSCGPDVISFSSVMDCYAQAGAATQAEQWFERMVQAGIAPDTVCYNTVIKAYARGSDLDGAERWLRRARQEGVRVEAFGYNAVIAAGAKAGEPRRAEAWLRRMVEDGAEPDVVSYNSVISGWAKQGDADGAERVVNLMLESSIEPDVVTLGASVHACAKIGERVRAEALFARLVARGKAKPDAICYNALINAAVKAGDINAGQEWLDTMLKNGVKPSVVSYTTVLHAHARAGNIVEAEKGLKLMLETGVEANVVSYSALIHACVKAGDMDRAEHWFEHMRGAGIKANAVSYSSLLNVCAKAGHVERAERWLGNMVSDGVPPNVVCVNNVIDACARAGRAQRAEAWLRLLTGRSDNRSGQGPPHGTAVVVSLLPSLDSGSGSSPSEDEDGRRGAELAEKVRCSLPPRCPEFKASRLSYTAAAQAYASNGGCEDAERIFAEMESSGMSMDEFGLTVLLSSYGRARPRQRNRAEALFTSYVQKGLKVTKPPLRALKTTLGSSWADRLVEDLGVEAMA